ncbi:MAG TPA: LacI family DNA-binding transcriptional regulator [Acidobacteriaceae bacterium]|nr:LacI family DNA-binding transcriptional regulator [Acidobacteriaceae bacterium]
MRTAQILATTAMAMIKKPRKPRKKNAPRQDIRTVASLAKVSIATVSRTINHIQTVDPVLAKRVWKAIEELDYFPNTQARALVSGKSNILGLIVSEITNPFFPELIQRFEECAVDRGYEILITSTNYDHKRMQSCVRRMLERKVDGVAVMTFGIEEPLLEQLANKNIPLVYVDSRPQAPEARTLNVDYRRGIWQAVQHLAVLGHRKIAFISGPLTLHTARLRHQAFVDSLQQVGITPNPAWLIEGDHTLEGGLAGTGNLLQQDEVPTAILCSNDMTAIGVLHAVLDAGLRVPEDISVIGFDDVHMAQFTYPPLTTIRMSCRDLAQGAVAMLCTGTSNASSTLGALEHTIPTELIVRRTTTIPRHALKDLGSPAQPLSSARPVHTKDL